MKRYTILLDTEIWLFYRLTTATGRVKYVVETKFHWFNDEQQQNKLTATSGGWVSAQHNVVYPSKTVFTNRKAAEQFIVNHQLSGTYPEQYKGEMLGREKRK